MKKIKSHPLVLLSACLLLIINNQCTDRNDPGDTVFIENEKIKLGFDKASGKFVAFSDKVTSYEFIEPEAVNELPWEVRFHSAENSTAQQGEIVPSGFTFSKPDPMTLVLKWKGFKGMKGFKVNARISLDKEKALSYWKISVEGIKGKQIMGVVFPRIEGINDPGEEKLVIPGWTGELMNNPRHELLMRKSRRVEWVYPGALSSQVFGLYNSGN